VLWYLNWLDFEVSQGSLLAYFENAHGRHVAAAVAALRRIGADGMADVVEQGVAVVDRHAGQWSERRRALNDQPMFSIVYPDEGLAGASELDALTDAYWNAAEADDWGEKLEAYLESQRSAVLRWASP
jgi:Domain of unknown function (DUF4375)